MRADRLELLSVSGRGSARGDELETEDTYRRRKLRELAFLSGRVRRPLGLDERAGVDELIEAKLALSAARLAQDHLDHPELRETNFRPYETHEIGDYELRWTYQSSDLEVENQPLLYEELFEAIGTESFQTELKYFSTGMGGLASLLLALDKLADEPISVMVVRDAYFQTLDVLRNLTRRLRVCELAPRRAPHAAESHAAESHAAESHAAESAKPPEGDKVVLFLDSIGEDSHSFALEQVEAERVALVVFDTSCYLQGDAATVELARAILERRLPLVLARSHQKLDAFGLEWGRLGSAFYVIPDELAEPRRAWVQALCLHHQWVSARTGAGPLARSLIAYPLDRGFRALNAARVERLRCNNRAAFVRLADSLDRSRFRVVSFHHALFGLLEVRGLTDVAALEALARQLVARARDAGVPTRCAATFGFDVIAVDTFFDLRRTESVGQPTIRISISDLPTKMVDTFCEVVLAWSQGQA